MNDWRPRMKAAVAHFADQVRSIRSGTVDAGFVASVTVDRQGKTAPVRRLAQIRPQGDRMLIAPFDPADTPAIARALTAAGLSAYAVDPATVAASVPPISGEQREKTAKHIRKLGEDARIAVRAIRQSARKAMEATGRGSQRAVQEETDRSVAEIDAIVKSKLDEIAAG